MASEDAFGQFVARVRAEVDARLAPWLDARVSRAASRGADVETVADAVRSLVMRGGKRMRAVLLAAAYEGCGGEGGSLAVVAGGASLELLQAYLLVHDDWMDGDDLRRGGPSVPAMMRERLPGHADAASVLAGDLAAAWAAEALLELELPAARVLLAARELARVEEEVIHGQVLDVRSRAADAREVEAVHALKTASYTVRGPLVMGARLAGASEPQVTALAAFATPLGVAFQLRDDVLGTFGDAGATGKPAGGDLRKGKRTVLVVDALADAKAAAALGRVLGRADATDEEQAAAVAAVEASGARRRVEERIAVLTREAREALARAELRPGGRALLESAIVALTERSR
ncbi:MAG TPA: polyprenyl synthetase family protein [Polyangiaceae bacterium]|jgi:geranylgeranyl diphosphate synthase type I